ncbi:MAG: hypothetical protein MEQ84_01955 [Mesorhizobium sp.]|nr:hypothetical protein [Mesorhizobium sp.]
MYSKSDHANGGRSISVSTDDFDDQEHSLAISLNNEQMAAVEGWRAANRIESREEAVQELVRIGLLSEIGRIYRIVAGIREDVDDPSEDGLEIR